MLGVVAPACGAARIPAWLEAAAQQPTPAGAKDAPAVVLLDETVVTVQPDGRYAEQHRNVVRILNRGGTERASGAVSFLEKRHRVRSSVAWLLRNGAEVKLRGKREWTDVSAAAGGAIYDETRKRVVGYSDVALVGDVFAFETVVERELLFAQLAYRWDSDLPRLVERVRVVLPAGWTSEAIVDGPWADRAQASAAVAPGTWELRDLPYRAPEPWVPGFARMDARLRLNLYPAPGAERGPLPAFATWGQVADWDLANARGQCDSGPALAAKVNELVAGCADPLARIRALARHVQSLRYVAVNKGLADGMGYRPRKATEVEAKGWGDCKDKANLLCAMLREVGIEAFSVSARIDGLRQVGEDWPSPSQFNHAIAAIRVGDDIRLPAVVEVAGLGRLLFFDATDPDVLPGDLPWPLQGTLVHVLAPGHDALTPLPVLDAAAGHAVRRTVAMWVVGEGVVGTCSIAGGGRLGAGRRAMARRLTRKDFGLVLAGVVNETVRGAVVQGETVTDDEATGDCRYAFEFAAARFGQFLPGGLRLVRLDVLSRDSLPSFPAKERTLPVSLPPICQEDDVELALPAGWVVDELPTGAVVKSEFGEFACSYEVVEGKVLAHRAFRMPHRIVPVEDYGRLRGFLADVVKAEKAAVILRAESGS